MATPNRDEETKDTSQFKVVSHPKVFKICDNIRDHPNMFELKNIDFGQLTKEEKNNIEESIYSMMAKFKTTPLDLIRKCQRIYII